LIEVIEYRQIVRSATVLRSKLRLDQRFHRVVGRIVGYDDFDEICRLAHGGLNRLAREVRAIATGMAAGRRASRSYRANVDASRRLPAGAPVEMAILFHMPTSRNRRSTGNASARV
jgi:hypothetical protein